MKTSKTELILSIAEDITAFILLVLIHILIAIAITQGTIYILE